MEIVKKGFKSCYFETKAAPLSFTPPFSSLSIFLLLS